MKPISKAKFQRLKRHYNTSTCTYCGELLTRNNTTRDHIVPRSKGGALPNQGIEHLTLCCIKCNTQKGDEIPEVWGMILLMATIGSIVKRVD